MTANTSTIVGPDSRRNGLLSFTNQLREVETKDWDILVAKVVSSTMETEVPERSEVIKWVRKESDSGQDAPGTTRLIFTHSKELAGGDLRADYAPLPKADIRELIDRWDLPPLYPFLRLRGNGSGSLYRRCARDASNTISSVGIVIQTPYKIRLGAEDVWSVTYTWTAATKSVNAFCDAMTAGSRQAVLESLQAMPERRQHPLWISLDVLESLMSNFSIRQAGLENSIYTLEENLGLTVGISNESVWTQDHVFFRKVTADCNLFNTWLNIMERLVDFGISVADFLLETQEFLEMEGALDGSSRESKEIKEEVWNYRNHLRGQVKLIQALSRRTTALLSIVNTIVTQLDSRTTTTIATATKRDSSSMITVAFLTTLFLPGTFISSLFGTNFFNFLAPLPDGTTVAGTLWIYWAITIPLTAFVMVSWQVWMRYFSKGANGDFGRKKKVAAEDGTDDGNEVSEEDKEKKKQVIAERKWIASKYQMFERWNEILPRRVRGGDMPVERVTV